jgi:phytoene dehydrogenase-like protein
LADKSIVIIGAGIAGLSTGCYGRMNGYGVRILEQDTRPGGLCTSWERKGYTIHGNMAFLAGSGPGVGFHRIWQELGVVPATRMVDYDYFIIVEGRDGGTFSVHTDIDRLERHMKELGPEDHDLIAAFIQGIRVFAKHQLPMQKAPELLGLADKLKFVFTEFPLIKALSKWKNVSISGFAARFKSPLLRAAFEEFKLTFSDDLPVAFIQLVLAWSHNKSCGYPVGGGLAFAHSVERRFLELGGEIEYNSRVVQILVKDDVAVGVRTENGEEYHADYVVSAGDGRRTIFDWLGGKYINARIQGYYRTLPVSSSAVLVGLGVARSFAELPWSAAGWIYYLDEPAVVGGKEFRSLRPMIYNFDPSLAPPGKTFIRLLLQADYAYWNRLREDPARYRAEKEKIATTIISLLDKRYPGLAQQVEMWDVATPLTFERYTGNWQASILGWEVTKRTIGTVMNKTLPGLKNFYMAGQWVSPGGGIPGVAACGRNVIQLIARQDRKRFVSIPAL